MSNRRQPWHISLLFLFFSWHFAAFVGCKPPQGVNGPSGDPIADAIRDVEEAGEKPYLEASRAILKSLEQRDYSKFYDSFSPLAFQGCDSGQFAPRDDNPTSPATTKKLNGLTRDEFLQQMAQMESILGIPWRLDSVYVQTIDKEELAGRADALTNAFNIGAISSEIPAEIRRASLRAQIKIQLPEEAAQTIAQELKIPIEDVRAGKIPENDVDHLDEWPYLTFKYVLIEDQGQLKIGYFEFLPPSMLDEP
jgi:hypothetical protein